MKSRNADVKVDWEPEERGGRHILPPGPKYSTVAKFRKLAKEWPEEAWSVVLHFVPADYQGRVLKAKMTLLAEDVPGDVWDAGETFELYEGRQLVGRGKVESVHRE